MSFFFNHINAIIDISIEIPVTIANPCISFENGNGTFIPQILAINVGNDKTIVKDTIINGKSESKIVYVQTKVKCPDSKTIRDTIEIDKKVIIKDTSDEVIINDKERQLIEQDSKIKGLEKKISNKNKQLFYLYLVISLYVGYNAIKFYIKNKTKL